MKGKFSNQVSVRQIDALHVNVKDLLVASIPKKKKRCDKYLFQFVHSQLINMALWWELHKWFQKYNA